MNDKVVSSSQYLAGFLVSMDLKKIDDIAKEKKTLTKNNMIVIL